MRIQNEDILALANPGVHTAIDMGASFNTVGMYIGNVAIYAIQLVFTGSPVGTFKLQASADPGGPNAALGTNLYPGVTNWTDIDGSSQDIAAAGNHLWSVANPGYQWVRIVYTRTSGTGSLTSARLTTKGV